MGAYYRLPLTHYSLYLNKYLFKLAEIWLLFFQVTALSENRKKNFKCLKIDLSRDKTYMCQKSRKQKNRL